MAASINGTAVALVGIGGLVAVAGLKNSTITDAIRSLAAGRPVAQSSGVTTFADSASEAGTIVANAIASEAAGKADSNLEPGASGDSGTLEGTGGTLGQNIAASARKYLGDKYVFGAAGPKTFDCSGLLTYVLHHDNGLNLPSNTHTVAITFYTWSGATDVPISQIQAGDLVCWTGHCGIATGTVDANGKPEFIDAPHTGAVVRQEKIWTTPTPRIRRVKPQ